MLINLIDARRGLHEKCVELFADKNIAEQIYRKLCEGIDDCEAAEKTGKWIPCKERLPEENSLYLVTHTYKYGNTDIAVNRVKIMLFWAKSKSWQVDGITAWMPLPQPYKGE